MHVESDKCKDSFPYLPNQHFFILSHLYLIFLLKAQHKIDSRNAIRKSNNEISKRLLRFSLIIG